MCVVGGGGVYVCLSLFHVTLESIVLKKVCKMFLDICPKIKPRTSINEISDIVPSEYIYKIDKHNLNHILLCFLCKNTV